MSKQFIVVYRYYDHPNIYSRIDAIDMDDATKIFKRSSYKRYVVEKGYQIKSFSIMEVPEGYDPKELMKSEDLSLTPLESELFHQVDNQRSFLRTLAEKSFFHSDFEIHLHTHNILMDIINRSCLSRKLCNWLDLELPF